MHLATLLLSCVGSVVAQTPQHIPFAPIPDLFTLGVDDVMAGFAAGQFSSVDLVKAYTARIAEVQNTLRPVIEFNPDAIDIAQALDDERVQNMSRGPLHGVPVLLKDNIGTKDRMNMTAGSYALYGSIVPQDATVTANLRAAGAVILGKAGLSEWAFWRGNNNSNGWSARGGQVKGAYYLDQDPSGSSSGSGVAASLGLATLTIGTDTGGSIIAPSDQNAIVGIRPSTGLTSRSIVVPITPVQDTIGPMCKSVKDVAYTLTAMAGPRGDPGDNYTNAIPFDTIPDYASYCVKDGLVGARLGIPRNIFPAEDERIERDIQQINAFNAILPLIASLGADITDNANYPEIDAYNKDAQFNLALTIGMKDAIRDYFAALDFNPTNLHDINDLLQWTYHFPAEQYAAGRSVDFWEDAVNSDLDTTSDEYLQAIARNAYLGSNATIQGALDAYNLDALVVPTAYGTRPTVYAGYPIITVPLGFFNASTAVEQGNFGTLNRTAPGIPYGISFIGRRFDEQTIIKFAYAFEQATQFRYQHLPMARYVPTTQLGTAMAEEELRCPEALGLPIG